jgi:hypothetical protein
MLQLQEADIWKNPATTTWAAEFLLKEGENREFEVRGSTQARYTSPRKDEPNK